MAATTSVTDHALLRTLLEAGSALASTLDLDSLLDLIADSACRIFRTGASSILLIDEETNTLFFKTATGEKREELKNIRLKMGHGIAGWVAQQGKPLIVNNCSDSEQHAREIGQSINFTTHSLACVPLRIRDKVIGVLQVLNRIGGGPFLDADTHALMLLAGLVSGAIEKARLLRDSELEREDLRRMLDERYRAVGTSPAFQEIMRTVRKVAVTKTTVLLRGESGSGKEVLARALHRESTRSMRNLVTVNCAAITETLLESELFGHEKGSFTGADRSKKGKFELADGGTIFLDEIGCMGPTLQAKLLRVVQDRTIDRVGGARPVPVDVRIIAATNLNLEQAIKDGRFREDLFYRLNVIAITLPPLRQRREDIPVLVAHFVARYSRETAKPIRGVSPEAMDLLMAYDFPGNVRELENLIERAVVLGDEPYIQPDHLATSLRGNRGEVSAPAHSSGDPDHIAPLDEVEEAHIRRALAAAKGKKVEACRLLGISRPTLDRKVARYHIRLGP